MKRVADMNALYEIIKHDRLIIRIRISIFMGLTAIAQGYVDVKNELATVYNAQCMRQ